MRWDSDPSRPALFPLRGVLCFPAIYEQQRHRCVDSSLGRPGVLPNIIGVYYPKEKHMHFLDLFENKVAMHKSESYGRRGVKTLPPDFFDSPRSVSSADGW